MEAARADSIILQAERDTLIERVSQLQSDCQLHIKSAQDSQALYHSALEQHANTAKQFKQLNLTFEQTQNDLISTQLAMKSLESKANNATSANSVLQQKFDLEMEAIRSKNTDLYNRNQILLSQLELFSRIQATNIRSEGLNDNTMDEDTSIQNLQEIMFVIFLLF